MTSSSSSNTTPDRLLKAIVTEFSKYNFTFTKSMRIIGSIHVVVDNNEVLSCLLNESVESTNKQIEPKPIKNDPEPLKLDTNETSNPVASLNKRKRFVPRAHLDPEPSTTTTTTPVITTLTATENIEKTATANLEQVEDSMLYDNMQESFGEEFQDTPFKPETKINLITPGTAKNRQVRFNDVTNSCLVETETPNMAAKKLKADGYDGSSIQYDENDEQFEVGIGGEESEGEKLTNIKTMTGSGRRSMSAAGGGDQVEYECIPCEKKFKYYCYYKRHMDARHSDEPKFVCEICSKSYKWEASFRHHLRSHESTIGVGGIKNEYEIENKEN